MAVLINLPSPPCSEHRSQSPKELLDFPANIAITDLIISEPEELSIRRCNTATSHISIPDHISSRVRSHSCPLIAEPLPIESRRDDYSRHSRDLEDEMSGYYYNPHDDGDDEDDHQQHQQHQQHHQQHQQLPQRPQYTMQYQQPLPQYSTGPSAFPTYSVNPSNIAFSPPPQRLAVAPQALMAPHSFHYQSQMPSAPQHGWTLPSSPPLAYTTQGFEPTLSYASTFPLMGPQTTTAGSYLSPPTVLAGPSRPRPTRTASNASRASSVSYNTDTSRGESPSAAEMARWGTRNADGSWSCSHTGCTSKSTFTRGCDLRKHYKRHTKTLFCRYPGCPQATTGGFSSNKDRTRHEQKHAPNILCEWGCGRKFSRVDNMKDHVRRVHHK